MVKPVTIPPWGRLGPPTLAAGEAFCQQVLLARSLCIAATNAEILG